MAYLTTGGASITSGAASARPTATGSGNVYICDDTPVLYLDDKVAIAWKQYGTMGYTPGPGLISNWTVVGNLGLTQKGDSILGTSNTAGNSVMLQAIPGPLVGQPYAVDMLGWLMGQVRTTYPQLGVCIANGTTSGSSTIYHMTRYSSSNGWGAFHDTMGSGQSGKSTVVAQDNNYDLIQPGFALNARILNDNTTLFYQISSDGEFWRTWATESSPGGITQYGAYIGTDQSGGFTGGFVEKLRIKAPLTHTISAITSGGQVTTTTAHGLATGMSVSITGVSFTGSNPNGNYDSSIVFVDAFNFTIPVSGITYISGGVVTNLSQ